MIIGLLVGLGPVGSAAAQAPPGDPPQHRLLVSSHGVTAAAKLFAFCRGIVQPDGRGMGICGDGVPTPTRSVPAHGGGPLLLVTGVRVNEITARVGRLDGSADAPLRIAAADASGRRFIAVLPPGPPLPLLSIMIRYSNVAGAGGTTEGGDAAFSIGLTEHRHARARPKQVTASARVRCRPPRGRRRSCRLHQRGRIEPPVGTAADCRGGLMRVRLIARGRSVLRARARTSADCRYRLRGRRFSLPRVARQLVLRTRFVGSSSLGGSRTFSVRLPLRFPDA